MTQSLRFLSWIPAVVLVASPLGSAVKLEQKKVLTIEAAKEIAAAAIRAAATANYEVTVAICDDGGHPLYLERMDEANPSSVETSSAKAIAAVLYKQPTKNFADRLARGETLVLKLQGAMPVEGGFPLVVEGKVIGAIGVGGAPRGELDSQIARAGVEWLAQNLEK